MTDEIDKLAREIGDQYEYDGVCCAAAAESGAKAMAERLVEIHQKEVAGLLNQVREARVHGPQIGKVIASFSSGYDEVLQITNTCVDSSGVVIFVAPPEGSVVVPESWWREILGAVTIANQSTDERLDYIEPQIDRTIAIEMLSAQGGE